MLVGLHRPVTYAYGLQGTATFEFSRVCSVLESRSALLWERLTDAPRVESRRMIVFISNSPTEIVISWEIVGYY